MSLLFGVAIGCLAALVALMLLGAKLALDMRIVAPWTVVLAAVVGLVTYGWGARAGLSSGIATLAAAALTCVTSGAILAWRFFRDPDRIAPTNERVVVSPADGKVLYVRKISRGAVVVSEKKGSSFPLSDLVSDELLQDGAWLIGIEMSWLDVHVNRAPIAGVVTHVRHVAGRFLSLRNPRSEFANERMLMVIDGGWLQTAVILIASRLVRRIVGYVSAGEVVKLSQRIGKITLGSQVDLALTKNPDLTIVVKPGQHVKAGQSVIAART
jgi:phosphatidylserine decarboxylase